MLSCTNNVLRHITWEQMQERIQTGIPFIHRVPPINESAPPIDIHVSEYGAELALRIPCVSKNEPRLIYLEEIFVTKVKTSAGIVLEVKVSQTSLFQEIYSFFVSVIDKVQLSGIDPLDAVEETLDGWRELIRTKKFLSEESQLGLRGELYFLRFLEGFIGDHCINSWVGPEKQPHDFRVGGFEFEVKATRALNHAHIINGLAQLEASPDHSLYIVSLRWALSGAKAGTTISEEISITRDLLSRENQARFDKIIKNVFNYKSEHASYYSTRLQLAGSLYLIPVNGSCPRLTKNLLSDVPHRNLISDVRYLANFDGLGYVEGSKEFLKVFSSL